LYVFAVGPDGVPGVAGVSVKVVVAVWAGSFASPEYVAVTGYVPDGSEVEVGQLVADPSVYEQSFVPLLVNVIVPVAVVGRPVAVSETLVPTGALDGVACAAMMSGV
jgi:hypothetical protein